MSNKKQINRKYKFILNQLVTIAIKNLTLPNLTNIVFLLNDFFYRFAHL